MKVARRHAAKDAEFAADSCAQPGPDAEEPRSQGQRYDVKRLQAVCESLHARHLGSNAIPIPHSDPAQHTPSPPPPTPAPPHPHPRSLYVSGDGWRGEGGLTTTRHPPRTVTGCSNSSGTATPATAAAPVRAVTTAGARESGAERLPSWKLKSDGTALSPAEEEDARHRACLPAWVTRGMQQDAGAAAAMAVTTGTAAAAG